MQSVSEIDKYLNSPSCTADYFHIDLSDIYNYHIVTCVTLAFCYSCLYNNNVLVQGHISIQLVLVYRTVYISTSSSLYLPDGISCFANNNDADPTGDSSVLLYVEKTHF